MVAGRRAIYTSRMKIDIRLRPGTDQPGLRAYIERRLRFGLARYGAVIQQVRLQLEDVNGPRSGLDKRCTLRVTGPRMGPLFLEETDALATRAVDRLSDRVDRTLARALERARAFEAPVARPPRLTIASAKLGGK